MKSKTIIWCSCKDFKVISVVMKKLILFVKYFVLRGSSFLFCFGLAILLEAFTYCSHSSFLVGVYQLICQPFPVPV